MKTCFSEGKLIKQFGNPLLSKRTPTPLSTNPLFLRSFFMTLLFVQISKTRPPLLILGWGGNYAHAQLRWSKNQHMQKCSTSWCNFRGKS